MKLVAVLVASCLALLACDGSAQPRAAHTSRAKMPRLTMTTPRADQHATVLADGEVLVTGGCTLPGCEGFDRGARSELFDPTSERFRPGPQMHDPRVSDATAVLRDGRILFAGGYPGEGAEPLASAEIFDPRRRVFTQVASMMQRRADATAVLLADGRVLVAGGTDGHATLASTEYFDPATNAFAPGPSMLMPRQAHTAVLAGGQLVVLGGVDDRGVALATTEVLREGGWARGPTLVRPRVKHAAATLPDGRILVVGGASSTEGRDRFDSTELVDLRRGVSVPGPQLSEAEYKLSGALATLPDGRIVIAGGTRIDVYNPITNHITVLHSAPLPRRSFVTASAIGDNQVLLAGGYDDDIVPTASARLITAP